MTNKTLLWLIFFTVSLLTAACSNNDDDADNMHPNLENESIHLKKQTISWFFADHHDTTHESVVSVVTTDFMYGDTLLTHAAGIEFIYDSENRLISTIDSGVVIKYDWEGEKLVRISTMSGYYDGGSFTDTTDFFYEGDQLVASISTYAETHTQFLYKGKYLSAKYITHTVGGESRCDSLLYTWEDGNVTAIETRSSYPLNSVYYKREFRYDKHPSWTSAINYPHVYLFVCELTQFYGKYPLFYYEIIPWRYNCRNNPVEFIEHTNIQTKITPFELVYNDKGYPVHIHSHNFSIEMEYFEEDGSPSHH